MMKIRTRGKGTIDCGLRESVGTLDDVNPTRLSKRSQGRPLTETGKVKIMRCPPLCSRVKLKEEERKKKRKRVVTLEEKRIVRWAIDNKEDWEREEEIEEDHRKIEEIVPRKFLKWRKVFRKVKLERMPMRKV